MEEPSFKNRQMITKLRVSDHTLEIETGRYKNIPRENRNCKLCKDEIDDEYHFLLNCKLNSNLRNNLFSEIIKVIINFKQYEPLDKLRNILSPKAELLPAICDL